MKKLISLLVTAALLLSLCACGKGSGASSATATDITDRELQQFIQEAEQARGESLGD